MGGRGDEALHRLGAGAAAARQDGLGFGAGVGLCGRRMVALPHPRRRRRSVAALAAVLLLPGLAVAQAPPGGAAGAPLREEPGDWWGDVHRWTGSDATRPPGARVAPAAPAAATGSVTTSATARSNIRREPAATAPVQRVVRPGTVLQVFGEAPGGWLQVGQGAGPIGWIHRSALQGQ